MFDDFLHQLVSGSLPSYFVGLTVQCWTQIKVRRHNQLIHVQKSVEQVKQCMLTRRFAVNADIVCCRRYQSVAAFIRLNLIVRTITWRAWLLHYNQTDYHINDTRRCGFSLVKLWDKLIFSRAACRGPPWATGDCQQEECNINCPQLQCTNALKTRQCIVNV